MTSRSSSQRPRFVSGRAAAGSCQGRRTAGGSPLGDLAATNPRSSADGAGGIQSLVAR